MKEIPKFEGHPKILIVGFGNKNVTETQIIEVVEKVAQLIYGLKMIVRDLEYYCNILLQCSLSTTLPFSGRTFQEEQKDF
jgi:hypothetical protein